MKRTASIIIVAFPDLKWFTSNEMNNFVKGDFINSTTPPQQNLTNDQWTSNSRNKINNKTSTGRSPAKKVAGSKTRSSGTRVLRYK